MTQGQALYAALQDLRRFHREVSILLQTADTWMHGEGYTDVMGASVIGGTSYSLGASNLWSPPKVFRFYKPPVREDEVLFVSVLMCPLDPHRLARRFTEPLISVGGFRFERPQRSTWKRYGWSERILDLDHPRDGTFFRWAKGPDDRAREGCIEEAVMARPLIDVSDSDALAALALEPLVRDAFA